MKKFLRETAASIGLLLLTTLVVGGCVQWLTSNSRAGFSTSPVAWDSTWENDPDNTDSVSLGDDHLRQLKQELSDRLDVEHDISTHSGGTDVADTGRHREGAARAFMAATVPSAIDVADDDSSTAIDDGRMWFDDDNENMLQVADSTTFEDVNVNPTSVDAGAGAGPTFALHRNSATPADADVGGVIQFTAEDSAGNEDVYASIQVVLDDVTTTTEDGRLDFYTNHAGTLAVALSMDTAGITQTAGDTFFIGGLLDGVGAVDMDYGSGDIIDHTFITDGGTTIIDGSITLGAGLLDATGAVDMDYGSADITDHTFIADGGTTIIDGSITLGAGLLDATGAVDMDYGSGDITDHTFIVDGGNVILDGTVEAAVGFDCTGAADCDFGSADITDMTFVTDGGTVTVDGTVSAPGLISSDVGFDVNGNVDMDMGSADVDDFTILTDGGTVVIDGSITMDAGTTFVAGGLIDPAGVVDMDYGSADVTDHTFLVDGGTVILDGTVEAAVGFDCTGAADCDIGSNDITDITLVTDGGTVTVDGTVSAPGVISSDVGFDCNGNVDCDYGSADVDDHTFIADGGTVVIDGTIAMTDGLTFTSGGLVDAAGAVDLDFGSADVTDMTFITDGGTITMDGSLTMAGDIDMAANGNRIDLDTDNDTSIRASGDDIIIMEALGEDFWTANNAGALGITITDNDSGAGAAPSITYLRDSTSPAASDVLVQMSLRGRDSGANLFDYGTLRTSIIDPTNGSEDGLFEILVAVNGSAGAQLSVSAGVFGAGATGGAQGTGTSNWKGVYDDGAGPLTDYPIEWFVTGQVDHNKYHQISTQWGGTTEAMERFLQNTNELDPKHYFYKWNERLSLPSMPTAEERATRKYATGELVQGLWEATEVQAVHIEKLRRRIVELESLMRVASAP